MAYQDGTTPPRTTFPGTIPRLAHRLVLGGALLVATGCTGTNLEAGLTATGLDAGLATTTVAAATPSDALLPPAAVPGATAASTASAADASGAAAAVAEAAEAAATPATASPVAAAPVSAAPVPPAIVPSGGDAAGGRTEAKPFRLLALAPTETRREKRAAFRARAERASLVGAEAERRSKAGAGDRRAVRILKPRKAGAGGMLPGVRSRSSLFQVGSAKGATGTNDGARSFRVASAAGLARLSGNGLRKQTAHVKTECFKPALVAVLRRAEQHFGRPVMVTSGYRSPRGNSRAGGAKSSKHISCEAADFQIEGVSKWTLAKYLRALPGRGGVGTYCHTQSVHYDIGSKRDWNWGCRKRK